MATNPSQFNARSDNAALALKGQMRDRNGQPLQPRPVQVGADGQPARPLPPEGSYARQAIERQQAQAAARANPQSPPSPSAEEQPPQPNGQPQPIEDPQVPDSSPNAQRRFSELTSLLRQKDQELQQAKARSKQMEETATQTQARLEAVEQRFNQMVGQNLEALDPETRMQVLQDARIQ